MIVKLPIAAPLIVLATLLALLAGSPLATAAQARTAGTNASSREATYAVPAVGSCHTYSFNQARKRTETSAPVDCATPHTAITIDVATVRSLTSDRAVSRAAQQCDRTARKTIGSLSPKTAFSTRFFLPTKAEAKQGARWVRCDVVLLGGRNALTSLPADYLASPPTDATALCAVTTKKVTSATVCALEHDYRYTAHYRAKGKKYPGDARLLRSVILTCAKKVSTPKRFWAFYPDRSDWNAGLRQVSCLSHTKA